MQTSHRFLWRCLRFSRKKLLERNFLQTFIVEYIWKEVCNLKIIQITNQHLKVCSANYIDLTIKFEKKCLYPIKYIRIYLKLIILKKLYFEKVSISISQLAIIDFHTYIFSRITNFLVMVITHNLYKIGHC